MFTMIIRILVYCNLLFLSECLGPPALKPCLTGDMTDIQSWVDAKGILTIGDEYEVGIDLSANLDPVHHLQQEMDNREGKKRERVKYLSMARCRLTVIPKVFHLRDSKGHCLAETLEYITFYGNDFAEFKSSEQKYDVFLNATGMQEEQVGELFAQTSMAWSRGFRAEFPRLRELDLRACKIQVIGEEVFKGMSNLKALYLGENKVLYINPAAFVGLRNLLHLDISKNTVMNNGEVQSLTMESYNLFEPLVNLLSLDMSFTKLTDRHVAMIKSVGPKLRRLSLCDTGLTNFPDGVFNRTSLRILDLSTNYGIFSGTRTLMGLENTLQTLYAKDTGLRTLEVVKDFKQLKILDVSYNEITNISPNVAKTLSNLHILNLDTNRIAAWFEPTLSYIPSLEILSIKENNINIISDEMIEDITDIKYIAMAANFFVCTCLCRDFFDVAVRNERNEIPQLDIYQKVSRKPISDFHIGYIEYKDLIRRRNTVRSNHTEEYDDSNEDRHGKYLLLDFHPSAYTCILTNEKKEIEFEQAKSCNRMEREMKYANVMQTNKIKMYALISLPGFTIMLMALYIFRRNLKYFVITLRNSAMLSLVHKHEVINDGTIFHYDVFVSYCNEDRGWVLNHLLPQLEADCNISTCLHERDFQVGYSILENIVSCMDRSRSIMLIISQRFLLSQWCQFEMHLAQHRLLETRREDLTLVLLEDIPRRLRPNTLHYLMLTKTYIVWPKDEKERAVFWRRIKKTLVTLKQRQIDAGVSLA